MNILFSIVYLIFFLWFLNRRYDLFSLTFLTSTIYFLPAFFGFTHDGTLPVVRNSISIGQYCFYFFYFTLLFIIAWIFSKTQVTLIRRAQLSANIERLTRDVKLLTAMTVALRLIVPLLLSLAWIKMGSNLFVEEKQMLLDNFSIFYSLFQTTALIYLLSSYLSNRRIDFLLSLGFLSFDMVVGFRAASAFALICLGTFALFNKSSRKRILIFAGIILTAYVFASIYKTAVQAYRMGTATEVVALLEIDTFLDALTLTESFVQQEVFSAVISSNLSLPLQYPFELVRAILPGINNLLLGKGLGFNDYYQSKLFPHVQWGMASNVWAELYAMWGWLGPVLYVSILFFLLFYLNKKSFQWLATGEILKLSLLIYLAAPFYFYMHRNDFLFQLIVTRNFLVVGITVFFLAKYIFPVLKIYKYR